MYNCKYIVLLLFYLLFLPYASFASEPVFIGLSTANANILGSKADSSALQGLTRAFLMNRSFNVLSPEVVQATSSDVRNSVFKGLDSSSLSKLTKKHGIDLLLAYKPVLKIQRTNGSQDVATIVLTAKLIDCRDGSAVQEKTGEWTFTISSKNTDPANSLIVSKAMRKLGNALGQAMVDTKEVVMLFLRFG
ncbi:hypothetical protein [Desulfoplanes sp.]